MPPWTRSNGAPITAPEFLIASASRKPVNCTGFASLPNELYGEIASHIPRVPVSCYTTKEHEEFTQQETPSEKFDRHRTLYSLSQTCRALRSAFLRYLWETIEVYDGFGLIGRKRLPLWNRRIKLHSKSKKLRMYAEELLRQLEIVTIRNTTLAQHVKSLNVLILSYSFVPVFKELLRCIPNPPAKPYQHSVTL
ncbi:hypothetical protein BJ165DRAFT_1515873 [Panaeolus papilionaceus]|nr:hypothetical protein BJ165DRAFT_1515873 [Panaeolus papilionaceus]